MGMVLRLMALLLASFAGVIWTRLHAIFIDGVGVQAVNKLALETDIICIHASSKLPFSVHPVFIFAFCTFHCLLVKILRLLRYTQILCTHPRLTCGAANPS